MVSITTKKGDGGETGLFSETGVSKGDPRIVLIGENDEIQSLIGLLKIHLNHTSTKQFLTEVQKRLYEIMGELSGARSIPHKTISLWTKLLEEQQKILLKRTKISNVFIIPGENEADAWCQYVRSAVRRLERTYCVYAKQNPAAMKFVPFINRLSDYLFVLGRSFV